MAHLKIVIINKYFLEHNYCSGLLAILSDYRYAFFLANAFSMADIIWFYNSMIIPLLILNMAKLSDGQKLLFDACRKRSSNATFVTGTQYTIVIDRKEMQQIWKRRQFALTTGAIEDPGCLL